jgi:hypothetical protein
MPRVPLEQRIERVFCWCQQVCSERPREGTGASPTGARVDGGVDLGRLLGEPDAAPRADGTGPGRLGIDGSGLSERPARVV